MPRDHKNPPKEEPDEQVTLSEAVQVIIGFKCEITERHNDYTYERLVDYFHRCLYNIDGQMSEII